MSKLVIICGISFAGKSTLGEAIAQRFGYVQVDVDDMKFHLYGPASKDEELSRQKSQGRRVHRARSVVIELRATLLTQRTEEVEVCLFGTMSNIAMRRQEMSRLCLRWFQRLSVSVSLFLVLALLLSACGLANPGSSRQEPSLTSRLDILFTSEVKEKVFSGSVLITKGGSVLLRKGYSMADWPHQLPNTPTTKFHIGSLTKAFTAMAILILQERGKLHVQDRICLYVSACPFPWRPITIQQLLTHTSGMTSDLSPSNLIPLLGVPSSAERNLLTLEKEGLDFPPGTQYSYSNVGYMVLGYLIEKVSQEPFALFLQKNIFAPLHLTNTGFNEKDADVANLATGYSLWQSPIADEPYLSIGFAAGGLYSTVDDLSRWDQALSTQQLVSQKSLKAMLTPYVSVCPTPEPCPKFSISEEGYGYGWFIGKEAPSARRVIWHAGVVDGFRGVLIRYPDDKVSVIVLSNLATLDYKFIPQVQKTVFTTNS